MSKSDPFRGLHKFAAQQAPRDFGAGLVDELIKGAQQNSFGRRVVIQQHVFDPVDVAKVAGSLQALKEANYTLKQASEALQIPAETLVAILEELK